MFKDSSRELTDWLQSVNVNVFVLAYILLLDSNFKSCVNLFSIEGIHSHMSVMMKKLGQSKCAVPPRTILPSSLSLDSVLNLYHFTVALTVVSDWQALTQRQ